MSGAPRISRGERSLRVFISSVIAGLTTARAEVAEVVRELNMEPWVFEQTPAHSGGLETSYLEQVAESDFVIWLEDGRTTEPVELEIRRAVESGRPRLLVFRLPAETRDERTQTLIAEVRELVKYLEVDEQGLASAVRATLDDELARAVRRPELPDGFALPARTNLRGRGDLAESLAQDIANGATVVISGMGGMGKTALAVELAHRHSEEERTLFVPMRGLHDQPAPASDLLAQLLVAVDVPAASLPDDVGELSTLWRGATTKRGIVLVLDDARDEAHVRPLLPGTASRAIVTSRATLASLDARLIVLEVLEPPAALEVLADSTNDDRIEESPAATELGELCGRLPLALYIAGRRLASRPAWTVEELTQRLRDERARLSGLQVGDLAVRASFNLSYDQLDVGDAAVFRRLGMFAAGNARADAMSAITERAADDALERLADLGLLDSSGAGLYRIHDLMRIFAAERLAEEPEAERTDALRRLARHLVAEAGERRDVLEGAGDDHGGYRAALRWFDGEWPTIVAVGARLAEAPALHSEFDPLAGAVARYAALRRRWQEWAVFSTHAITAAEGSSDQEAAVRAHQNLGIALIEQGEDAPAREQFELALEISTALGHPAGQARALAQLGSADKSAGLLESAVERLRRAVDLYRDAHDAYGEASALGDLGNALELSGQLEESVAAHREALGVFERLGEPYGQVLEHGNLGVVLAKLGDAAGAERAAAAAIDLAARFDQPLLAAKARLQRAGYLLTDGRPDEALAEAEASCDGYAAEANASGEAAAFAVRAAAQATLGRPAEAIADHEQAAALFAEAGSAYDRARHLAQFAEFRLENDEIADARRLLEDAVACTASGDLPELRIQLLGFLADVDEREGDPRAGEQRLLAEVSAAQVDGDELREALTLARLAALHRDWGEGARARELLALARSKGVEPEAADDELVDVVITGAIEDGDQRKLGRILTKAHEELGAPLARLDVAIRNPEAVGPDWSADADGVALARWLIDTPDDRAFARLVGTAIGAIAHHVLVRAGVDDAMPLGEVLTDVARAWVQQRLLVVEGPVPEDTPALPTLTGNSSSADISAVLGAALSGNTLALARLEAWQATAEDVNLVEALREALTPIDTSAELLTAIAAIYAAAEAQS